MREPVMLLLGKSISGIKESPPPHRRWTFFMDYSQLIHVHFKMARK
jgi:hypothetical protein